MNAPLLSLVVPVYNVARYLPEFLSSLQSQSHPGAELDLVFVDDGSTDSSADLLEAWCQSNAPHATVLRQGNAGLSAARNAGLDKANGTWVTFCDPDDVLGPGYLSSVCAFLASRRATDVRLVCANVLILDEAAGTVMNRHPLRFRFAGGTQVVDLEHHPGHIHLQAASGFYRRDEIDRLGLRFDPHIVPNFEDASFTALYLADRQHPLVAFVAEAHYLYRRRADGGSLTQGSWAVPEKYTMLPRHGYLLLAQRLVAEGGRLPEWVQNLILYDLFYYLREDERQHSPTAGLSHEVTSAFHRTVREVLSYVDVETIEAFSVVATPLRLKRALVIGYKEERLRPPDLAVGRIDADKVIAQVRYFFGGDLPVEEFRVRGRPIRPIHAKVRDLVYLGEVLVHERIVWLPADGTLRIAIDGRRMPLTTGPERDLVFTLRPVHMWRTLTSRASPNRLAPSLPAATRQGKSRVTVPPPLARLGAVTRGLRRARALSRTALSRTALSRTPLSRTPLSATALSRTAPSSTRLAQTTDRARSPLTAGWHPWQVESTTRWARSRAVRMRYGEAWVFMDRDDQAHDNAEHLYRHVRDHHPEVNSWFVLRRDSADWIRLQKEGFRLVPFGSNQHALLLLHADHVLSSQVDHYVLEPFGPHRLGPKRWRFTFLQHGVTKDDLSRWVNAKPISLFVTATSQEYESIAGDHTPYTFTSKEVRLTGFPRHDRLLELARGRPTGEPRLILVMPTWRDALLRREGGRGNARKPIPGFWDTAYAREWFGLLSSPRLGEIAARHQLSVVFMAHPNFPAELDTGHLPEHLKVCRYSDVDVQELLARAGLLVTDYSSIAFDVAYLERPIVYFQFDRAEFFGGSHVYRRGTWDYTTQGFGPVVETATDALDAVDRAAARLGVPEPDYAMRMRTTFAFRDGGCCERVYQEVAALTHPIAYEAAYVSATEETVLNRPGLRDEAQSFA